MILKALDKDPTHRYQTVRELGVDLERLTAGVSPLAKPRHGLRWSTIAAGTAAILIAGGLGGHFLLHWDKSALPGSTT